MAASPPPTHVAPLPKLERFIGNLLRYGVLLCAAMMAVGIAMSFFTVGPDGRLAAFIRILLKGGLIPSANQPFPCELTTLATCLVHAEGLITIGLALLIALPIARVGLTMVAFAVQRDWLYALVSALVLTVLLVGMLLGKEW